MSITSMEEVITNDDLLTQILLRLPFKSVVRFKSVSKQWLTVITDARFANLRSPRHDYVSGLLYNYFPSGSAPSLNFFPLKSDKSLMDTSSMVYIPNLLTITIFNSCNGLLLCSGYNEAKDIHGYHVLNPTTKQFETLPDHPDFEFHESFGLAYDPSISPHFKVISITTEQGPPCDTYQIYIYSSETKTWRASGERFAANAIRVYLSIGVYWNGAMNWLNMLKEVMYFNIEEEHVGFMPMSPVSCGDYWTTEFYFGESNGYLHFLEYYFGSSPTTQFNIYELRRDYSEWFVKYRVDLTAMMTEFPEMTVPGLRSRAQYSVAPILRHKDDDEESFMVLYVAGKFLLYNLLDGSYKIIYEHQHPINCPSRDDYNLIAYPYIKSLSPLPCFQNHSTTLPGEKASVSSFISE